MNKSLQSLPKCKKTKNDIFHTPPDVVEDCMRLIDIGENDTLLDPFYGEGAFYTKYPASNTKDWCEIEKGIDFFEYNKKVDWII